jgi:hypothetical protein
MSYFNIDTIINNPLLLSSIDSTKTNAYRDFILYILSCIPIYTKEQRQIVLAFLIDKNLKGQYRITKYDEKYRDYYNLMTAVYGITCPYFNADYSIEVNTAILIDILQCMISGCTCDKVNPLHIQLMH